MGIDPQDAGASGRGDARDRTDRHGVVAPHKDGRRAGGHGRFGLGAQLAADFRDGLGEGGVLLGVQLVAFGDFDVAEIRDGVPQCSQGGAQTGMLHGPRADVDPTQGLAKIEGDANDMDITWRNGHLCRIPEGGGPTRLRFR